MTQASEATGNDPRQRMPAAERRSQLVTVALERFAARGYHDTSMDEIAVAAGVTKPVLYQHFSSKQELYRELLDTTGQQLISDVSAGVATASGPYERILAGFAAWFDFAGHHTDAFMLLFGGSARTAEEFRDSVTTVEDRVAAAVGGMIEADIDRSHRDLLGRAIVGLAEVVARTWAASTFGDDPVGSPRRDDPQLEMDRISTHLADFVWAGLRGLPAPHPGSAARATAVSP